MHWHAVAVRTEVMPVVRICVFDLLAEIGDPVVCRFEAFFEVAFEPSAETAGDLFKQYEHCAQSYDGAADNPDSETHHLYWF